jgi:DNA repair protein RecN (Recombination protein N)
MLASLQIENVAVIEKAEVRFDRGLNVLTGETGAGKSILIDSINAILGNRTSRELIRTGAEKAVIRAAFTDIPARAMDRLEQAGYARESDLLLTREIALSGKSSCRINGMPATAAVMREICGGLVNIHGQHDSVGLIDPASHLGLLDAYAQNSALYADYYAVYRQLVGVKREMDALVTDEAEKQRKIELLRYETDEIDAAALKAGEETELEARRRVLANAEAIREKLAQARSLLSGDDETSGAVDLLGEAGNAMQAAGQLDPALSDTASHLADAYYSLKELAADLADRAEDYESGGAELAGIEDRLDVIYRLKQKYGADTQAILAYGEKAHRELDAIQFSEQRRAELAAQKRALFEQAREKAEALTKSRLEAFSQLNEKIRATLDFLNMPGVVLTLQHTRGPLASHGQDTLEFYISTNPGEAPKPLAKIASGGELSRIMLAIKSAMADRDRIPTIIYDEIDTGVSGLAAGRIGETLAATRRLIRSCA